MAAKYVLEYLNPIGIQLQTFVEFEELTYSKSENEIGKLSISLKADPRLYPPSFWKKDGVFIVWRSINNSPYYVELDTAWFIDKITYATDDDGKLTAEIAASDAMTILGRRIIAYESGNVYSEKEGFAEEIIKDVVRDNFSVAAIDADRDVSEYLSIDPVGDNRGAIIVKDCSWADVLSTIQEVASSSEESIGKKLIFDVLYRGGFSFAFKTWEDIRGNDRRENLIVMQEDDTLSNPQILIDFTNEKNSIYAVGDGTGEETLQVNVNDADQKLIPFGRREIKIEGSGIYTEEGLEAFAEASLLDYQSEMVFSGLFQQTTHTLYGYHYNFGDKLRAQYLDYEFDVRVTSVSVKVNQEGETIETRLEGRIGEEMRSIDSNREKISIPGTHKLGSVTRTFTAIDELSVTDELTSTTFITPPYYWRTTPVDDNDIVWGLFTWQDP